MASADILRADHSPLPWHLNLAGPRQKPQVTCFDRGDEWHWIVAKCEGDAPGDKTGRNNAAFIVRACNAHYQMLEALKEAASALDEQGRRTGLRFPSTEEVIRAAIAAAEAEAGR